MRAVFLAKAVLNRARKLRLDWITFMDNDAEKLRIYGGLSREIARREHPDIRFDLTTDAERALEGADFVITALRVGQDDARVWDERIPLQNGVLGQETTGAGGFGMAARTIPVLLAYMEQIRRVANPGAVVFNFTNPSGMITQALRDAGYANVYGICDAPGEMQKQAARLLGTPPQSLSVECFGLNHLSWFRSVRLGGREMLGSILNDPRLCRETDERVFEPELLQMFGMLLNEYLYYYYYPEKAVKNILNAGKTRGETIRELNGRMHRALAPLDPGQDYEQALAVYLQCHDERNRSYMSIELQGQKTRDRDIVTAFSLSENDDGGYAGIALNIMEALVTGNPCEMVLSTVNGGAVAGLADDDVVEITCRIGRDGAKPIPIGAVPGMQLELIRQVKLYEKLAIRAILHKDAVLAVKALMVNPLVGSYPTAKEIVRGFLRVHRPYLGGWSSL